MTLPTTIDDVLVTLDDIIAEAVTENHFLGIFAYVYRRTTAQVKAAILRGDFEDNERMERMDVAFANLYIEAYRKFQLKESISKSWQVAFEAIVSSSSGAAAMIVLRSSCKIA